MRNARLGLRTPNVSKFRHIPFDFSDDERCALFCNHVLGSGRSAANNVTAFFRATFDAWHDVKRTGSEKIHVGYSPIIVVDASKILGQMPQTHVLHVVRNPWSAYADTKKRPVPMSLERYLTAWATNQYHALINKKLFPDRLHILRLEDVVNDPVGVLGEVCSKLGTVPDESLKTPSWNGSQLEEVYPWGTIRKFSSEANLSTAMELSSEERERVRIWSQPYLKILNYENYL